MAFTVRLSNFTGTTHFTQVDEKLSIEEFKYFLAKYMYNCEAVSIFKNSREIASGTIESNGICPDDTLNIVCKLKTGFDLKKANEIKMIQKAYDEYYNEVYTHINDIRNEIENALSETEKQPPTPLELLGTIQRDHNITEEDYEKEDMRILFQRCRNQIEDEATKMKQTQKENERTKQKLEALKKKMSLKKKKMNQKSSEITTIKEIKKSFGGFKKGFLLK